MRKLAAIATGVMLSGLTLGQAEAQTTFYNHCVWQRSGNGWVNTGQCHNAQTRYLHERLAYNMALLKNLAAQRARQQGGVTARPDGRNGGAWNKICGGYGGCVIDMQSGSLTAEDYAKAQGSAPMYNNPWVLPDGWAYRSRR